jgi:glucose/arabinose dehydrogenase
MKRNILILALLLSLAAPACSDGGGGRRKKKGGGSTPPSDLTYTVSAASYRVGAPIAANEPSSDAGTLSIAQPLPAGLTLDIVTGVLSGTPTAESPTADYTVTLDAADGPLEAVLTIQVTPTLPPEVLFLEDGFAIEAFASGLEAPAKMDFAPDGRLFFNELATGRVRVLSSAGVLDPTPFAEVTISTGGERGLLGLALAPDFETAETVYVFASVPSPLENRVLRLDAGGGETVIVGGLPIGNIHNGGDIRFGPDGMLYVSVGDTGDSDLAQTDGVLAGRMLRYRPDGTIPLDNPDPASPEWCRGLRNSFDMAFHPVTGGLFASENGPTFGDEVNLIRAGKNFEWPSLPPGFPGSEIGTRVTDWTPVIAPTGIAFVAGGAFGPGYEGDLFVCGYVDADVRRLALSGPSGADLDEEVPFLAFVDGPGVANKPLDVVEGPDGALYVSTFTAIWRVWRY